MTAIAAELDRKLQSLDPQAAWKIERLVREVLRQTEKTPDTEPVSEAVAVHRAHLDKFAGIWLWDDFERPPQGEFEKREDW